MSESNEIAGRSRREPQPDVIRNPAAVWIVEPRAKCFAHLVDDSRSFASVQGAEERLCEVAAILAQGYVRLRIARQKAEDGADPARNRLAPSGDVEAQCGSRVQTPESEDAA